MNFKEKGFGGFLLRIFLKVIWEFEKYINLWWYVRYVKLDFLLEKSLVIIIFENVFMGSLLVFKML